jgi:hypothetical protein
VIALLSSPSYKKLKIYIFTYFYILLSAIINMTPAQVAQAQDNLRNQFTLTTRDPYMDKSVIGYHQKRRDAAIAGLNTALELANNN